MPKVSEYPNYGIIKAQETVQQKKGKQEPNTAELLEEQKVKDITNKIINPIYSGDGPYNI